MTLTKCQQFPHRAVLWWYFDISSNVEWFVVVFFARQSKDAGIRTLVMLDEQGGECCDVYHNCVTDRFPNHRFFTVACTTRYARMTV